MHFEINGSLQIHFDSFKNKNCALFVSFWRSMNQSIKSMNQIIFVLGYMPKRKYLFKVKTYTISCSNL